MLPCMEKLVYFAVSCPDHMYALCVSLAHQHQYISQCMTEIKKELKQENMSIKANAVSKLTYVSGQRLTACK